MEPIGITQRLTRMQLLPARPPVPPTRRWARRAIVPMLLAVVLLPACSFSGGSADLPLNDREFWSVAVTQDGQPVELVEGTRIRIEFQADGSRFSFDSGCNSAGGEYTIRNNRLEVGESSTTLMGCEPDRAAQENWTTDFFMSGPDITLIADELVLQKDGLVITFADTRVVNPDNPLVGTVWTVDGFTRGPVAMSIQTDKPAQLIFNDDGSLTGFDGCAPISGRYAVDGGDLQLIEVVQQNEGGCDNPEYVRELHFSLRESMTWEVRGDVLELSEPAGDGLTARVVS